MMQRNPLLALTALEIPPINIDQTARHDHVHITLPAIIHWLCELNHVLSPPPLPVTFRLTPEWRSNCNIANTLSKHIDMLPVLDPEVAHNLCHTTHLVLGKGLDPFVNPQLFCRWLRLFLSAWQVSWDDPTPWLVAPKNIPFLTRQISLGCPTAKMIIAQGVWHSISAILASMETVELSNAVASQFVELPTEVLLLVFDLLDNVLFSLTILCHRIHFLALPIFLERHSIHDPCDTTRLHLGWMPSLNVIIRALTIFLPSITNLICVFPDYT
jgi:hypothetical protein